MRSFAGLYLLPGQHKTERESMTTCRFFRFIAFVKVNFCFRLRKRLKVMLSALMLCSICFYIFSTLYHSQTYDAVHVAVKNDAMTTTNGTPSVIAAVGALNIHVWREVCGSTIQNLRQYLLFPHYPDEMFMKLNMLKFQIIDSTIDYGQRIFGFLHVQAPGSIPSLSYKTQNLELTYAVQVTPITNSRSVNPYESTCSICLKACRAGAKETGSTTRDRGLPGDSPE